MTPPSVQTARPAVIRDLPNQTQREKFAGFDFLRAIFAVMVVVLHANLFVVLTGKLQLNSLADILSANVGYLAVPVFLQISLFLFFIKSEKAGSSYFVKKRLPKLVSLYLFWSISKLTFDFIVTGESSKFEQALSSPGNFIGFIMSGGYSAFYFFFSLLFLTAIAALLVLFFRKINRRTIRSINHFCLLISCILVFLFPVIDSMIYDRELLTQIHNPIAFLPYVFTAAIAAQEFNQGNLNHLSPLFQLKLSGLLVLFLTFTVLEWNLFERFPQYSRLSLVSGSWLLLYLALLTAQKSPPMIQFLSDCSLGIYGLHPFFTDHTLFLESTSEIVPGSGPLIRFLVGLLGSILLTLAFRKIKFLRAFL
jgi:surface polysaccharide O-acyltransferase-like enzyme